MPWEVPITIGDTEYPVTFHQDEQPSEDQIHEAISHINGPSFLGASSRGVARGVIPALGATAGASLAAAPFTGGTSLLVPVLASIAGGFAGYAGAEKAQEAIAEKYAPESIFGRESTLKDLEAQPYGEMLGRFLAGGRPSVEGIGKAADAILTKEGRLAMGRGLQAIDKFGGVTKALAEDSGATLSERSDIDALQHTLHLLGSSAAGAGLGAVQGQSPGDIALSTLGMTLFNRPYSELFKQPTPHAALDAASKEINPKKLPRLGSGEDQLPPIVTPQTKQAAVQQELFGNEGELRESGVTQAGTTEGDLTKDFNLVQVSDELIQKEKQASLARDQNNLQTIQQAASVITEPARTGTVETAPATAAAAAEALPKQIEQLANESSSNKQDISIRDRKQKESAALQAQKAQEEVLLKQKKEQEKQNALQESSSEKVLPRQPGDAGKAGGEREGVGPSDQGKETSGAQEPSPSDEKIVGATYTDPNGVVYQAENHIEAAKRAGVEAPNARKEREGTEFGFMVKSPDGKTRVVDRVEAERIARQSSQLKPKFQEGKVPRGKLHSDQLKKGFFEVPEAPKAPERAVEPTPEPTAPKNVWEQSKIPPPEPKMEQAIQEAPLPEKPRAADIVKSRLEDVRKRIAEKKKNLGMSLLGIDPALAADYLELGALHIADGAIKFADWSKRMISDIGEDIKSHLAPIWNKLKDSGQFEGMEDVEHNAPIAVERKLDELDRIARLKGTGMREMYDAVDNLTDKDKASLKEIADILGVKPNKEAIARKLMADAEREFKANKKSEQKRYKLKESEEGGMEAEVDETIDKDQEEGYAKDEEVEDTAAQDEILNEEDGGDSSEEDITELDSLKQALAELDKKEGIVNPDLENGDDVSFEKDGQQLKGTVSRINDDGTVTVEYAKTVADPGTGKPSQQSFRTTLPKDQVKGGASSGSARIPSPILDFADGVYKHTSNFVRWGKSMIQKFGNGIKDYLRRIWKYIQDNVPNTGSIGSKSTEEAAKMQSTPAGGPFRWKLGDLIKTAPNGDIEYAGRTLSKDGTLPSQTFDAVTNKNVPKDEYEHWKLLYPEAFKDYRVNVKELADKLASTPAVETHVYGQEGKSKQLLHDSPEDVEHMRRHDELHHTWWEPLSSRKKNDYNEIIENYDTTLSPTQEREVRDFLKDRGWSDKEIDPGIEIHQLDQKINQVRGSNGPRATQYYNTVSPLDTKTHPVKRIDVVIPKMEDKSKSIFEIEKMTPSERRAHLNRPEDQLWNPDNLHENLPNTLGWAMVQPTTNPKTGEQVWLIGEMQSRWEQTTSAARRDVERLSNELESAKASGSQHLASTIGRELQMARINASHGDHPLLSKWESLVLKSVIDEARKSGVTKLVLSDGETAMMTEGHDKAASKTYEFSPDAKPVAITEPYEFNWRTFIPKGYEEQNGMVVSGGYHNASGKIFKKPNGEFVIVRAAETRYGIPNSMNEIVSPGSGIYQVRSYEVPAKETIKVQQDSGMRAQYDQRGPDILRKLTGDNGQTVDLGDHKNAGEFVIRDSSNNIVGRYATRSEAKDNLAGVKNGRIEMGGSSVFKDSKGNPKTNITGRKFDLMGFAKDVTKKEAPTFKLYSDPFLIRTTADALTTMTKQAKSLFEFSGSALKRFGEWVGPHLRSIWNAAKSGVQAVQDYFKGVFEAASKTSERGSIGSKSNEEASKIKDEVNKNIEAKAKESEKTPTVLDQARTLRETKDIEPVFSLHEKKQKTEKKAQLFEEEASKNIRSDLDNKAANFYTEALDRARKNGITPEQQLQKDLDDIKSKDKNVFNKWDYVYRRAISLSDGVKNFLKTRVAPELLASGKALQDAGRLKKIEDEEGKVVGSVLKYNSEGYLPRYIQKKPISGRGSLKAREYDSLKDLVLNGDNLETWNVGEQVGRYMRRATKILSEPDFIGDALNSVGRDGAPNAIITSIHDSNEGENKTKPLVELSEERTTGDTNKWIEDRGNYKQVDHISTRTVPIAIRKSDGTVKNVLAEVAFRPEIAKIYKNEVGRSAIKQWYNEPSETAAGRVLKGTAKFIDEGINQGAKSLMFVGSPFHAVTTGLRALGHGVVPFGRINEESLNAETNPKINDYLQHGAQFYSEKGEHSYGEGVGTFDKLKNTPVGKTLNVIGDWMFGKYIPWLQMKTYEAAEPRVMKSFGYEPASEKDGIRQWKSTKENPKESVENVKSHLWARINDEFGHLNWRVMGSDKTMRHLASLAMLAPQFTIGTLRTLGAAAKGTLGLASGREQSRALWLTAALGYAGTRVLNALLNDGDFKAGDLEHPFSVMVDGKEYHMRTLPGEILAMTKDGWLNSRLSPVAKFGEEELTHRNYRGEKITQAQALQELGAGFIPMSLRSLPGLKEIAEPTKTTAPSLVDSAMQFLGINRSDASPIRETYKRAAQWKSANGQPDTGAYPVSKWTKMKRDLEDGEVDAARDEWTKLVQHEKDKNPSKSLTEIKGRLSAELKNSMDHAFVHSKENEKKFYNSLSDDGKAQYKDAIATMKRMWHVARRITGSGQGELSMFK